MVSGRNTGLLDVSPINILRNILRNILGNSEGDLGYLRDNGLVNGCIVDDTYWRLDEGGNWPEAI